VRSTAARAVGGEGTAESRDAWEVSEVSSGRRWGFL